MRVRVLLCGVIVSLLCITEYVVSIFLTTTLMTGFMGGYLIGRLPLGTFISILATNRTQTPSLNVPSLISSLLIPRDEVSANANENAIRTETNPNPIAVNLPVTHMEVPVSLDNKIRDRFIHQLALMDPLDCLPKIFCEVSADPYGTAMALNHLDHRNFSEIEAIHDKQYVVTKEELVSYETHLRRNQTKPAQEKPSSDIVSDDKEDSDEGSDSEAESDEDDSFEQYRQQQDYKLEMQALEEMVDDIDDPVTYYYILQDKKRRKNSMKKKGNRNKFRHNLVKETILPPYGSPLNRRMSIEPPPPPPPLPPLFMPPMRPTTEASLDNMFADDPFFSDFGNPSGRSSRNLKRSKGSRRSRTGKEETPADKKENMMKKYKVAFLIADKYKSPAMCSMIFPTCPYQTRTILSIVNRLQTGLPLGSELADKKDGNIEQFKNTLLAIERLNKATLQAKNRGEPINIERVAEAASRPSINTDSNTSEKIVSVFQEVVDRIGTNRMKRKKHTNKPKRKHEANNTQRRHYHVTPNANSTTSTNGTTVLQKRFSNSNYQDDETHTSTWDHAQTFNQTYVEMFKTSQIKSQAPKRPKPATKSRPTIKPKSPNATTKPIQKFGDIAEDDERDDQDSEDAVNMLISKAKPNKTSIA